MSSSTSAPPAYEQSSASSSSSTPSLRQADKDIYAPPAIQLQYGPPNRISSDGILKIHVPAWGVALVRPPSHGTALPGEDTIISGSLEVIMNARRRCKSIRVVMQGISRVYLGAMRGWEEDGIFEQVIEVLDGQSEHDGIWLEKGSQSFAFNLVLPASLATHDCHAYGLVQYHLIAIVEGCKSTSGSLLGLMKPKEGWLKGDLSTKRVMLVHAITDPNGGVHTLDLSREGEVDHLGVWRIQAVADVWSVAAACLLDMTIPAPSPKTTIFLTRLVLFQSYTVSSPRTSTNQPNSPERIREIVLYSRGRPHPSGEKFPDQTVDCLWRGSKAGGLGTDGGWSERTIVRLPTHRTLRPSTHEGTITPIRVSHILSFQVFYSVEGELASGRSCDGPGELRLMELKSNIMVPSCCCTISSLDLPPYTSSDDEGLKEFDQLFQTPAALLGCMCGCTLEELSQPFRERLAARRDESSSEDLQSLPGIKSLA